ncbi:MAG TPA: recombinase family protein [Brevundimonas sp.]|uniref:recombinase family protein n=1 Tax=Brevundimonas sp. TaxID=1871086 RepID=UPI002633F376|nr:recombinase family protein [Brevundimonas sp.]HRO33053.1 recombinase family protein [Brevundimonas sp.]
MAMFNSPLPPKGARAILLARFSDNHQNPLSADDQLDVLRADCERYGWEIVGEFKDEAKSGRTVANRTGYIEALAAVEAGLADVLCVFHLDRLGRNARELHDANNRLRDNAAVIFTHDRGVMSRFEFAMYAEMAQMESERIGERTTRGRLAAAARGKIMGDIPYGYRAVTDLDADGKPILNSRGQQQRRIEIHPEHAAIVLRANLDFEAGKSPNQIAIALTAEGVPTPEGGRVWHPNTIAGVSRSMSGLLRNPMYVGKIIHGKVKTELNERTGKVAKRRAPVADRIEHDMPWLRIVPQEVWDANQAKLALRPPSKLVDRRRPTYLLSGLVKCGVCGGSYVQVAMRMGCTAHKLKACSNGRRVRREDLERVVLDGLTQRLAETTVMTWFIPEYLRERGAAAGEADERHARAVKRAAEVEREIDNVMRQIRSGAKGIAAEMLNDDLETLGAERQRLKREVSAGPRQPAGSLTADSVVERMTDLFEHLGDALQGDERDATRARDVLRGLITAVYVTPYDVSGKRPDGRGTGAVRVQIEGEISRLIDRAMLDRKIMHGRGAEDMHDLPIASFRFYVDLDRTLSPGQEGLWSDAALISRMLDDAEWPILFQEMVVAMNDRSRPPTATEAEIDETRARIALAQFKRTGWARAVRLGGTHGWVWKDRGMTDDQWRARYDARTEFGTSPVIIRLSAPEAGMMEFGVLAPFEPSDPIKPHQHQSSQETS